MALSDRQIRRMTEERTVIIDNVDTSTGQITMHDQYGTTLNASLDFADPVVTLPMAGESWIAKRKNTNWYLSQRQQAVSDLSSLSPGDTQITSKTTIHLSAPVINIPNSSIDISKIIATGTPSSTTFLRGDATWSTVTIPPGIPTGALMLYGDTTAPSGWLIGDGSAVSRTGVNAALFALYGTRYGIGDGTTTFNLPDMRGRVPVGYAATGGHTDVSTLGANDGQAATNRRPKHRTSFTDPGHHHSLTTGGAGSTLNSGTPIDHSQLPNTSVDTNLATTGITIGTGVTNDALDTPSYIVINYIIKL